MLIGYLLFLMLMVALPVVHAGDLRLQQKVPIYELVAKKTVDKEIEGKREELVSLEMIKKGQWLEIEKTSHPLSKEEELLLEKERTKMYGEYIPLYKKYDDLLKNLKNNPKEYSLASVMGGINYGMTLDEMKQKVKELFLSMKKNGVIISKEAFEKVKGRYFPVPSTNLTRIWGADHLKKEFNGSKYLSEKKYDVPGYVIVVDDPNVIKLRLSFGDRTFPIPLELENGKIYFEEIKGEEVGSLSESRFDLSSTGFSDFSATGNIIQDGKTGRRYVVDTELKSFTFPLSRESTHMLEYANKKFRYLNNDITKYELTLDLSRA
jgi:hypothetical protein